VNIAVGRPEQKVKRYPVENVQAEVCKEYGERYFHATTLDELDRYLSTKHDVKAHLNVELVAMQ
jgi:hypothetical protein